MEKGYGSNTPWPRAGEFRAEKLAIQCAVVGRMSVPQMLQDLK